MLTISLPGALTGARLLVRWPVLRAGAALASAARHHRHRSLDLAMRVLDATGATTALSRMMRL